MSDKNKNLSSPLYGEISQLLTAARSQVRTAVNTAMVQTYWQIGRLIVEEEQKGEDAAEYGKGLLASLSGQLTTNFGKGFSVSSLQYFRNFYLGFSNQHALRVNSGEAPKFLTSSDSKNQHAVRVNSPENPGLRNELSWTHYKLLIKVKDQKAREWYMNEAATENWSTRALERQINSFHYERLLSSQERAPVQAEARKKTSELRPQDILRDPYVLEFLQLKERPSYSERDLETALIDQLQDFLLELGKGFSFVSRQKRVSLDCEHFYIDLVFYNYLLKCFVIIDLKLGKLTHQDVGQLDSYVRLYEERYRGEGDNPTIGLILCSEKNEAIARYSVLSDHQTLFASKYQLILPSEEELARELEKEIAVLEKGRE